jgi:hypothetical protein
MAAAAGTPLKMTEKGKPRCHGRACGTKVEGLPGKVARYEEAQCARACEEGSNFCKVCFPRFLQSEAGVAPNTWHGRMGGPLPPRSLIVGGPRNMELRAKAAAAEAAVAEKAEAAARKAAEKAEKAAVTVAKTVRKAETEAERAAKAAETAAVKAAEKAIKEAMKTAAAAEKRAATEMKKQEREAVAAAKKAATEARKAEAAAKRATTRKATAGKGRRKTARKSSSNSSSGSSNSSSNSSSSGSSRRSTASRRSTSSRKSAVRRSTASRRSSNRPKALPLGVSSMANLMALARRRESTPISAATASDRSIYRPASIGSARAAPASAAAGRGTPYQSPAANAYSSNFEPATVSEEPNVTMAY